LVLRGGGALGDVGLHNTLGFIFKGRRLGKEQRCSREEGIRVKGRLGVKNGERW